MQLAFLPNAVGSCGWNKGRAQLLLMCSFLCSSRSQNTLNSCRVRECSPSNLHLHLHLHPNLKPTGTSAPFTIFCMSARPKETQPQPQPQPFGHLYLELPWAGHTCAWYRHCPPQEVDANQRTWARAKEPASWPEKHVNSLDVNVYTVIFSTVLAGWLFREGWWGDPKLRKLGCLLLQALLSPLDPSVLEPDFHLHETRQNLKPSSAAVARSGQASHMTCKRATPNPNPSVPVFWVPKDGISALMIFSASQNMLWAPDRNVTVASNAIQKDAR